MFVDADRMTVVAVSQRHVCVRARDAYNRLTPTTIFTVFMHSVDYIF